MLTRNKILTALLASTTMLASTASVAAETVSATASVTVQNAFTLGESVPLSFGTITVKKATGAFAPADAGTFTLSPEGGSGTVGGTAATGGAIASIVAGTPGTFDISNASAFTDLTVTIAGPADGLKNASAPKDNGYFILEGFNVRESGATSNQPALSTITVKTDLAGAQSFTLGATLKIGNGEEFIDGVYSGSYTVKVAY